jgi:hydroxymethylpyrimidine/phosphomethylpyrimidine kinase
MSVPIALTIAGSDSSGGAGIQADLKTFAALGVYGASVITALTAQNTVGVSGVCDTQPAFITAQIDAVFSDLDIKAVKIGMVSRPQTISAVVDGLKRWKPAHVVVDPVMVATSGDRLLAPAAIDLLRGELLPCASIATPNLPEAAALADEPIATDRASIERQARKILRLGPAAVLIKGGHGSGAESIDYLVSAEGVKAFAAPRVATKNTHGTGCSLSSAIAAGLARGFQLDEAVDRAKRYVSAAIAAADSLNVGRGNGPIHHFYALDGND